MKIEELKGKTVKESRIELEKHTISELKAVCKENNVAKGISSYTKIKLIDRVIQIAHDMELLKLGISRIDGNNVWIEYGDGTTEVIMGEIPEYEAGKGYAKAYLLGKVTADEIFARLPEMTLNFRKGMCVRFGINRNWENDYSDDDIRIALGDGITGTIANILEGKSSRIDYMSVEEIFTALKDTNMRVEKMVDLYSCLSLYEKITATVENDYYKFSNLPEAEIRVMLGFDANYMYLGEERGMYGLFTNDLNTVNVEDAEKATRYFEELVRKMFKEEYERATAQTVTESDAEENKSAEGLYAGESYCDNLGDNSYPEQDIPEAHTLEEKYLWTDEDFNFYLPNGEMTESELIELTLEELDALNDYLARKDATKWRELDEIRASQKYPIVVVKKVNVPPEDMMLYPIGTYDSYEEMKYALDKNFEMVDRCKDETDMQYLFFTCNLHTAYMMLKARGYETRLEEWQSIKENVVHDFIRQELARREKKLKRETISKKTQEIIAMVNKYAEISGTIHAILCGVKIFRKGIKKREKDGLPSEGMESAIKGVREEYRKLRVEGFKLRLKLLRVMSAEEIRRACEVYIARCEEIRRKHCRK